MDQHRRQLGQGRQGERALGQPRVGDRQPLAGDDQIVVQQDIEVDLARPVAVAGPPADRALDPLERREQLRGHEVGPHPAGGVEERRLRDLVERRRLVERRDSLDAPDARQRGQGRRQVRLAVAAVAAQAEVDGRHARYPRTIASHMRQTRTSGPTS